MAAAVEATSTRSRSDAAATTRGPRSMQAAAVAVRKANGPMTEETRSALRRFVRALAVTQRSRCVGGGEASL